MLGNPKPPLTIKSKYSLFRIQSKTVPTGVYKYVAGFIPRHELYVKVFNTIILKHVQICIPMTRLARAPGGPLCPLERLSLSVFGVSSSQLAQ